MIIARCKNSDIPFFRSAVPYHLISFYEKTDLNPIEVKDKACLGHLKLFIDDIDRCKNPKMFRVFTEEDAKLVESFVKEASNVLVTCPGGKFRSGGLTKALNLWYNKTDVEFDDYNKRIFNTMYEYLGVVYG